MYKYGGTKRRHRRRIRGGLTKEQEDKFLKKKQEEDRAEASAVGEKSMYKESPFAKGEGTNEGEPKVPVNLFNERQQDLALAAHLGIDPPPISGRGRRRKTRKHKKRARKTSHRR